MLTYSVLFFVIIIFKIKNFFKFYFYIMKAILWDEYYNYIVFILICKYKMIKLRASMISFSRQYFFFFLSIVL